MPRVTTTLAAFAVAVASVAAVGVSREMVRAASEPAACPRTYRLDLGASLDTIGSGRYACPGCDGAITDGERLAAAGQPLGPLWAVVRDADDPSRVLWEGELPPTSSPATRATIVALCAPPPYIVHLDWRQSDVALDAWLCPNSPWQHRVELRHFEAHGRRVPLPVSWRVWRCEAARELGGVICAVHCWLEDCDPDPTPHCATETPKQTPTPAP